ncbi:MAG: radical SAM protein [Paraclostridium sordellii]
MKIEFDVNDRLFFPQKLSFKKIDKYIIVLAPDYPNWIVLNKLEYQLFMYLRKESILNSMIKLRDKQNINEEDVKSTMQSLLKKIEVCQFYKDVNIRKEEKMCNITKNIHINLTNDCNLRCKHCYMSAGLKENKELNYEDIINFINKLNEINGKTDIVISGGEPLMYKDLFKLLKCIKQLNNKVILFTNGLLINEDNIKILKEYVDEIQISMEGITRNSYELIRGKNTYDKFMSSINLIKRENIPLTLAITVIDIVVDDIQNELINFLNILDFKKLNVRINDNVEQKGNAIHLNNSNFKININLKNKVTDIIKQLNKSGYNIQTSKARNIQFSNCGIGTSIIINYDGNIYPCAEYDIKFFDIYEEPKKIIDEFNKLNNITGLNCIELCKSCELRLLCNGGCRIKNYINNSSFTIPKCDKNYKEKKYYELIQDYLRGE